MWKFAEVQDLDVKESDERLEEESLLAFFSIMSSAGCRMEPTEVAS